MTKLVVSLRAEGEAISTPRIGDCFGANSAPTQKLVHRHCERSEAISRPQMQATVGIASSAKTASSQ